jgi:hypothetical protein
MPSVFEPFDISPLEAMYYDVPVIISKQSGVSEVLTHALKVDFWDVDDLADKMLALLRYSPLRQELRERGAAELSGITWSNAARLECLWDICSCTPGTCSFAAVTTASTRPDATGPLVQQANGSTRRKVELSACREYIQSPIPSRRFS